MFHFKRGLKIILSNLPLQDARMQSVGLIFLKSSVTIFARLSGRSHEIVLRVCDWRFSLALANFKSTDVRFLSDE